jgi:hypothetical protein
MNHSPAYIIAQYLINEGLVTDPSEVGLWKIYVGAMPDGDDVEHDLVGAMDTTPVKDGRLMTGTTIFHHGVQLLLRSSAYNAGYAKITALAEAMDAVDDDQVTIGSDTYEIANVTHSTGVVVLGQEEGTKRREMFSVNFLATLKEV